jgi:hypothetical protein
MLDWSLIQIEPIHGDTAKSEVLSDPTEQGLTGFDVTWMQSILSP